MTSTDETRSVPRRLAEEGVHRGIGAANAVGTDVAATVMSPASSVGGVVSCTSTLNVTVPTFPRESAAVHWTVVVPRGKRSLRGRAEQLTALGSRGTPLSAAVTVNVTIEPAGPFASTLTTDGAVNVGGETSTTHDCDAFPTLPAASVA